MPYLFESLNLHTTRNERVHVPTASSPSHPTSTQTRMQKLTHPLILTRDFLRVHQITSNCWQFQMRRLRDRRPLYHRQAMEQEVEGGPVRFRLRPWRTGI